MNITSCNKIVCFILMPLILLGCLQLHCLEYLDVQEHESVKKKKVFLKGTPVLQNGTFWTLSLESTTIGQSI